MTHGYSESNSKSVLIVTYGSVVVVLPNNRQQRIQHRVFKGRRLLHEKQETEVIYTQSTLQ